jgi:bifunctional oligoribonuclease and PAP phosphatase NrnA
MNRMTNQMTMNESVDQVLRERFANASRVAIASHVRPDGDAIGALLALGLSLQLVGKQVQMVLADGVPTNFHHLEGREKIVRKVKPDFDLSVVVDCSDLARTGGVFGDLTPDINIDHHITNLNFARVNLVDAQAVATSAILTERLPRWGLPINQNVAEALLTGIVSDSLGFRTSNTTPAALRLAADLMDAGANLTNLYYLALVRRSYESAHFWGFGLNRLEREDRMIWTSLTLADRASSGYSGNDDADLVNMLATIDDADVTVIFVEQKTGHVKVSWRGAPGINVSKIALQFGGGGHSAAAGADIIGDIDSVRRNVLQATRTLLKNRDIRVIENEDKSLAAK